MISRYLSIILILLCSSVVVLAEDEKTQTDKKEKTNASKPSIGKRAQVKTLEEFIPSEEVSADKAVAFPNDI